MVQSLHYFKPGQDVTSVANEDVTGARFVALGAGGTYNVPHVAHAEAGELTFGVSARDAKKGEEFLTHTGGIVPVTAGASLTAGSTVAAGADGKAVPAAEGAVARGLVLADAAANELASVHML